MSDSVSFALLAPVPQEHLESGVEVAARTGYVCFGSQNWNLFVELDGLRGTEYVPVLFYPSHDDVAPKDTFKVCYQGWYVAHVTSDADKRHDDADGHRPPTVDKWRSEFDSPHHWALFWRVRDLKRLPDSEQVAIGTLSSYKSGNKRLNKPPMGPAIIARPKWLK